MDWLLTNKLRKPNASWPDNNLKILKQLDKFEQLSIFSLEIYCAAI